MIHDADADAIFGCIDHVIDGLAPADHYAALFRRAIASVRTMAETSSVFFPVDLPMAVADALSRPAVEQHVAAAASTLLWAGADLMDDAADGELDERWSDVSPHKLALVSTNLLATLPHLLVAEIDGGAAAAAYSHAVSQTLFVMSDGQAADFDSHRVESIDDYMATIRKKTGAEFALFASTPPMLAGAGDDTIIAWQSFGFLYGAMTQVFSDIASTVVEGNRSDLLIGKRTLPVLHTLAALGGEDRDSFVADIGRAATGDRDAAAMAIGAMTKVGALRRSMENVELLRYRAAKALPVQMTELRPDHPLKTLMQACTL